MNDSDIPGNPHYVQPRRYSPNIMEELYPLDTEVDVYYNPRNPKHAYGIACWSPKWVYILLGSLNVVALFWIMVIFLSATGIISI